MSEQEQTPVSADLLKRAGALPANAPAMTEVDPFEREPRIRIGKELTVGMTINGYFSANKIVKTPKSKYADETIVHVLRVGSPTGDLLGLWTVAELGAFFENMPAGTLVSINYKSKGVNADGNDQHYFELKRSGLQ